MPMEIAICDDEKNIREHLLRLVNSHSVDCCVDLFASGDALLAAQKEYDLYFLDIQMPGINGMKTAEMIREKQKAKPTKAGLIIFITALQTRMNDAFDVRAFHYLVKPLDENKFHTVFLRAVQDCQREKAQTEKYIFMQNGGVHQKIFTKDIVYMESRNNKVVVNRMDGVSEYYATLQEIESALGSEFFRCHRCYLINMAYIKRYNSNTIWLDTGGDIPIAQKKYPFFTKAYMAFIKGGGSVCE